jgi:hypothetical protein
MRRSRLTTGVEPANYADVGRRRRPHATIPYFCTLHPKMTGRITVAA